jgi:CDP-glucose 4,6-dehydratase
LQRGEPLIVRNPDAVRPWQHVMEPLAGYLMVAQRLAAERQPWVSAWNFGPPEDQVVTVASFADIIIRLWGSGSWRATASTGDQREAHYLTLDCRKANDLLGWRSCLALEQALKLTVTWYRAAYAAGPQGNLSAMTSNQIQQYERNQMLSRSSVP